MDVRLADPKLWRALSTLALAVAVIGLLVAIAFDASASLAWVAFLLSGVFFVIELALVQLRKRRGTA